MVCVFYILKLIVLYFQGARARGRLRSLSIRNSAHADTTKEFPNKSYTLSRFSTLKLISVWSCCFGERRGSSRPYWAAATRNIAEVIEGDRLELSDLAVSPKSAYALCRWSGIWSAFVMQAGIGIPAPVCHHGGCLKAGSRSRVFRSRCVSLGDLPAVDPHAGRPVITMRPSPSCTGRAATFPNRRHPGTQGIVGNLNAISRNDRIAGHRTRRQQGYSWRAQGSSTTQPVLRCLCLSRGARHIHKRLDTGGAQ
jgi:hypothetical protein